jgi:succinate-semialdehyde dehydrogenase/glutarate-semialdehyde dehydrogenase
VATLASDQTLTELFIGGTWRPGADGRTFVVSDPATAEELCRVADASPDDGLEALATAVDAAGSWAAMPPRERGRLLARTASALEQAAAAFAELITAETGKPLAEAHVEVLYAAEYFEWFAGEATRLSGRVMPALDGSYRIVTQRGPVGPCLMITPWNFPLAMGARKVAAALAAGCTSVLKPAEQAPLSSLALAGVLAECGLPQGVVSVVPTSRPHELVEPLMRDARLRKLAFTGSTAVGSLLSASAADGVLRTSMELGGNAPFLVLDDADLDLALTGGVAAKFRNAGQACVAVNRFLVQRKLYDRFATSLAKRVSALRVGPGSDPSSEVGPLIDGEAVSNVGRLVDDSRARGARLLCGGHSLDRAGHFFAPTVIADVVPEAAILRHEIFGPVATVQSFDRDEDGIAVANATPYGLVAYVYSGDLDRALRVSDALETGMVAVNRPSVSTAAAPFGGVKASGLGREGGAEGIDEYLETKYLSIAA